MFLCCMGGWHRVICVLDNLNHAFLRGNCCRHLCDVHDEWITRRLGHIDDLDSAWWAEMIEGRLVPLVCPYCGGAIVMDRCAEQNECRECRATWHADGSGLTAPTGSPSA